MTTQDRIRDFIVDELEFKGAADDLANDFPLVEKEVIDSMGILQIIAYVEDEFGIEIDDADLVTDNFATINDITRLVESKMST